MPITFTHSEVLPPSPGMSGPVQTDHPGVNGNGPDHLAGSLTLVQRISSLARTVFQFVLKATVALSLFTLDVLYPAPLCPKVAKHEDAATLWANTIDEWSKGSKLLRQNGATPIEYFAPPRIPETLVNDLKKAEQFATTVGIPLAVTCACYGTPMGPLALVLTQVGNHAVNTMTHVALQERSDPEALPLEKAERRVHYACLAAGVYLLDSLTEGQLGVFGHAALAFGSTPMAQRAAQKHLKPFTESLWSLNKEIDDQALKMLEDPVRDYIVCPAYKCEAIAPGPDQLAPFKPITNAIISDFSESEPMQEVPFFKGFVAAAQRRYVKGFLKTVLNQTTKRVTQGIYYGAKISIRELLILSLFRRACSPQTGGWSKGLPAACLIVAFTGDDPSPVMLTARLTGAYFAYRSGGFKRGLLKGSLAMITVLVLHELYQLSQSQTEAAGRGGTLTSTITKCYGAVTGWVSSKMYPNQAQE